jgi:ornithine cyclodeaminase
MSIALIDDAMVSAHLDARVANGAIEHALREYDTGTLIAPARLQSPLGEGSLVFTSGSFSQGYGFRAYGTFPTTSDDQLTVVWDRDGNLVGIVVGQELGRRRTGALGAAAAIRLTSVSQRLVVGVLGAGAQAFSQLWAISAVRSIKEIRSYRRDPVANADFASRVQTELGLAAQPVKSPEAACKDVDLLIVATGASRPVIDDAWIHETCTIFTLGPKRRDASELPEALYQRAKLITSDSIAQLAVEGSDSIVDPARVVSLSDLQPHSGWTAYEPEKEPPRSGIQLYLSTGLAGTELFVVQALLAQITKNE